MKKVSYYFLYIFLLFFNSFSYSYSFKKLTILCNGGHSSVTRSILQGLKKLQINFNYNPSRLEDVGDVVHVLAGTNKLAQAISWKKRKRIKRLLAGPNLVVWPSDNNRIITSQEIDICIVPSIPTKIIYTEIEPSLINRIEHWYAGIDPNQWPFQEKIKNNNVLVYWKHIDSNFGNKIETILRKYNWQPVRLVYGSYNLNRYKKALSECQFAVFLSRSESQGIALAEAWAMNIPTFPWNPKTRINRGRKYSIVSSCPYLTLETGIDWKTSNDLETILKHVKSYLPCFTPRKWILQNMTDTQSALHLLNIIESMP